MTSVIKRMIIISRPLQSLQFALAFWWGMIVAGKGWELFSLLAIIFYSLPVGLIVFGINDIADRESDAHNSRKGGLDGAVVSSNESKTIVSVIIALSCVAIIVFLVGHRYLLTLTIFINILFSLAYSVKPIRLKSVPVIDSLFNGVWASVIFLAGYWATSTGFQFSFPRLSQMLGLVLLISVYHALGAVLDHDVDRKFHDRTISVFLGKRPTTILSLAFMILSALLINPANPVIKTFYAVSILFCFLIALRPEPHFMNRLKKIYFLAIAIPLPFIYLLTRP